MDDVKKGDVLKIHCYKHDETLYKSWDQVLILNVDDNFIVCGNNKTRVTESDGRKWSTKEPAILFFYKKKWFNIIAQFKSNGIFYYCNIASPYIIEDKTIKYIDYDIDLKIFPDSTFRILDKSEYEYHKEKMNYTDDIDNIVKFELDNLITMFKKSEGAFSHEILKEYYDMYLNSVKI